MSRNQDNEYYVTRQVFYYTGENGVEISQGRDSASPDMLVPKYNGERGSYADARDAVENAIQVFKQWRADGAKKVTLYVAGRAPQIGIYGDNPVTFAAARAWGKLAYEKAPKCDNCGEILGSETYTFFSDPDEGKYCREYCAERAYSDYMKDNEQDEDEQVQEVIE